MRIEKKLINYYYYSLLFSSYTVKISYMHIKNIHFISNFFQKHYEKIYFYLQKIFIFVSYLITFILIFIILSKSFHTFIKYIFIKNCSFFLLTYLLMNYFSFNLSTYESLDFNGQFFLASLPPLRLKIFCSCSTLSLILFA